MTRIMRIYTDKVCEKLSSDPKPTGIEIQCFNTTIQGGKSVNIRFIRVIRVLLLNTPKLQADQKTIKPGILKFWNLGIMEF